MSWWPTQRLKHVADINQRSLDEHTDPDAVIRYLDISAVGRGVLDSEPQTMRFADAPSRARRLVSARDTIVSTVRTYLRAVWPVRGEVDDLVVSTGFVVLSPRPALDTQFFAWVVQSDLFIEEIVARSVGVSYPAINPSDVGNICVPVPPLGEQRAIVDFLDRETARIDALITAKRRLTELLDERRARFTEATLRELVDSCVRSPLKYAVRRVEVGIVVTPSVWYSAHGVPALRGLNVKPGRVQLDDLIMISEEGHELHRKSGLRAGDVVVVRTGQTGAAAIVPEHLDGANCIDLVIVRPSSKLVPKYLEHVLNSEWTQEHIEQHSVGSIQSHFNVGAMREMPIPLPPVEEQQVVVRRLDASRQRTEAIQARLVRQLALLAEHRQALITAAVTGELDVGVAA